MILILFIIASHACNLVNSWNDVALNAIRKAKLSPPVASRSLAIFNVAVYDSTASISAQFLPYKYNLLNISSETSVEAAVISSSRKSLSLLFPDQVDVFTNKYTTDISALNYSVKVETGIFVGTQVAQNVFNDRATDGTATYKQYLGSDVAGMWRPTPPRFLSAEVPQYATQTPWCLLSSSQIRPPPPPSLSDQTYVFDHNQIFRLGALNDSTRTDEQTEIAKFWYDGPNTDTPPGTWAVEAGDQACARRFNLMETARLFALISMSLADSAIMGWDAKYTYGQWRPITAIRFANTTGQALAFDPNWEPFLNTPNWPDYLSDRAMFGGAASQVLTRYFGVNVPITVDADGLNISRAFPNFAAAAFEQAQSRVFAGSHFNHSVMYGLLYGQKVGDWTFDHCLSEKTRATLATQKNYSNTIETTENINIGYIVGGIVGAIILVICIGLSVHYFVNFRRRKPRGDDYY